MNTYVRRALAGLVAATALTGSLLAAVTPAHASFTSSLGGSISRSEVIERAQYWVDHQPGDYNQGASSPGPTGDRNYRRDCSGFVDMAWHLNSDPNTQGLPGVSTEIARTDLQAGDILDSYYDHVILFNAWEADHVHYSYYAFGATPVHFVPRASINDAQIDGHPNGDYKAYRYRNITGSQTAASASPMFADLDGDGRAEMIVASPNGNVTAYRNVSTSGLWAAGFYTGSDYMVVAGVGSNYDKLRFADLDKDGRAEMIIAQADGSVVAYRNINTSGLWAAGFFTGVDYMTVAGVGSNYDKVRFADLDKDGRAEMIIAQADGSVVAYRNINTTGLWAAGFFTGVDYMNVAGVGSNYDKVRFADLDKDGRAEMIIAQADGSLIAYRNINTTGLWAAGFFTGVDYMNVAGVGSNYDRVRFADLDKDGRAEMIIAAADGNVTAYRNINTTGLWAAGFYTGADYMVVATGVH